MNKTHAAQAALLMVLAAMSTLAAAQSGTAETPGPTVPDRGIIAPNPGNGPFLPPDLKPRPRLQLKPRMKSDELKLERRVEMSPEMSPSMQPNTQKPLRARNPALRESLPQAPPVVVDPRDSTTRPASLPAVDPVRDVVVPAPADAASAPGTPGTRPP